MLNHELTIGLSDTMLEEIEFYKKTKHKQSIEEAVTELLQYALTSLPPHFKHFDWEKAEAEADQEIQTGNTQSFDSVEAFIADLKQ